MSDKPSSATTPAAPWVPDLLEVLRPYAGPGRMVDISVGLGAILASSLKLVPPEDRLNLAVQLCTDILGTVKGSLS